eukprot:4902357-Amphidinium_carterae.1
MHGLSEEAIIVCALHAQHDSYCMALCRLVTILRTHEVRGLDVYTQLRIVERHLKDPCQLQVGRLK